jgi:lysophospholipase L1-like esterase
MTKRITREATRTLLIKICLSFSSVLFVLALGEGVLRLFPEILSPDVQQVVRVSPSDYGVTHPYIGYLHTPNKVFRISGIDFSAVHHVDAYGFRNPWPWPAQADVVVVGDSLTFGHGVANDQAWPSILDRALSPIRVINLGLEGAGPQQYLRVYETFGVNLQPKVLIVGFFVRNDFWDEGMFDRWLRSGAGGNYMVWRDFGRPKEVGYSLQAPITTLAATLNWNLQLLARRSHLYNFMLHVATGAKQWRRSEVNVVQLSTGARLRLFPEDFKRKTTGAQRGRPEFQRVLEALQRLQSIAREHVTHPLVVLQPSKEEIHLPLQGWEVPDVAAPLKEELDRLGISYLDLREVFHDRAVKGEKLFFEVDGHPNATGYALIAEVILSHLKESAARYGLKLGNPPA